MSSYTVTFANGQEVKPPRIIGLEQFLGLYHQHPCHMFKLGAWECPCVLCQRTRDLGLMDNILEHTSRNTPLADRIAFVAAADACIAYVKERRREKVGTRGLANLQRP